MARAANVIDVTEATFESDVIQRSHAVPVVVDFWAPWCGPCRVLGPVLESLAADPMLDFVLAKVNVDQNPNISMRYQVQGIPAVKAFVDGQVEAEFVGAQPEARVRAFIEKLIPSEVDLEYREARSLLATRHYADAEDALRDLLDEHPNHPGAQMDLARALLAQSLGCEAQEILERCLTGPQMLEAERLLPLARFLCRASEGEDDELDLEPLEAQYRQAARLLQMDNLEAAMDGLIDVLRQDKRYRRGEPKDVLLGLFSLLGDGDPLTQAYRGELANVLF